MKLNLSIKHAVLSILIFSQALCFSQNIEQTRQLAQNQYNLQNYDNALYFYQRVLFFENDTLRCNTYQNIGDCYLQKGNFTNAFEYYETALFSANSDSSKSNILLKKIVCLWNQNKFQLAKAELLDIDSAVNNYMGERVNLYLGITYYGLNDLQNADLYLNRYFSSLCQNQKDSLPALLLKMHEIKKYNIKRTRTLSAIMPGLGQLTMGEYRNAANSFILNLSLLGLMILTGYYYGPIDAILSVAPWGYRYYTGGIKIAGSMCEQKISRHKQICMTDLLNLMKKCE